MMSVFSLTRKHEKTKKRKKIFSVHLWFPCSCVGTHMEPVALNAIRASTQESRRGVRARLGTYLTFVDSREKKFRVFQVSCFRDAIHFLN